MLRLAWDLSALRLHAFTALAAPGPYYYAPFCFGVYWLPFLTLHVFALFDLKSFENLSEEQVLLVVVLFLGESPTYLVNDNSNNNVTILSRYHIKEMTSRHIGFGLITPEHKRSSLEPGK